MENIAYYLQLLSQIQIPKLGFTFLDIIILVVILFYAYEGYAVGFAQAVIDLLCFILSFILAFRYPWMECMTRSYYPYLVLASVGLTLEVFGFPLFLLLKLRSFHKDLDDMYL